MVKGLPATVQMPSENSDITLWTGILWKAGTAACTILSNANPVHQLETQMRIAYAQME
jgi:hypothetical protein